MKHTCLIILSSCLFVIPSRACTNFLITKGASADGATMISYSADSHTLYGCLYFFPGASHQPGTLLDITDWDSGKPLGQIKQVNRTYSVVGNMNERQVAIGETTFGGRKELADTAGIDYGSLMYIALQRASTAQEAIQVITGLVNEYGYASTGESFSIADPQEVWILEMIGKGPGRKGAVWVARKIPDGYISAHANQARITTFPLNDPDNCLYAEDVISFAKEKGYYTGSEQKFSFSDTYAPLDFGAARFCEMRVWAMFRQVTGGMDQYAKYVAGHIEKDGSGYASNRMPLWVKPDRKISLQDMQGFMRDHLEGTPFDMTADVGAGPFQLPYRWRGLTWDTDTTDELLYCHERATATQQTGFSFISQSRSWLPDPVGGILWFGVDDAASSVYTPMYCGMQRIPSPFREGNGNLLEYSDSAAFWIFNQVSNYTYLRYNAMIADVKQAQQRLEKEYLDLVVQNDQALAELYEKNSAVAIEKLTDFSVNLGNKTFATWQQLYRYLLIKYIDGNIKQEENGQFKKTTHGVAAYPDQPGYPPWWYELIIEKHGEKFRFSKEQGEH